MNKSHSQKAGDQSGDDASLIPEGLQEEVVALDLTASDNEEEVSGGDDEDLNGELIAEQDSSIERLQCSVLRDIPTSQRHFWRANHREQMALAVSDALWLTKRYLRPLPANELAVMALNEIAALEGVGFFMHLKSRTCFRKRASSILAPKSRTPNQPGADYPNIVYINFTWDDTSRQNFHQSPHRLRYLNCDARMNFPKPDSIALYPIQYMADVRYPLSITDPDSMTILAAPSGFYIARTSVLRSVIGMYKGRHPEGPDPTRRLNTMPGLWDLDHQDNARIQQALSRFHIKGLKDLYKAIIQRCHSPSPYLTPCLSAGSLRELLPISHTPDPGIALGTGFVLPATGSRRGIRYHTLPPSTLNR